MQLFRRLLTLAVLAMPPATALAADDPIIAEGYAHCTAADDTADMTARRDWCTAVLRKIPASDPRVPTLFANRGQARADLGEHADALKDLNRAISAEPANFEFRYWRGLAHYKVRHFDLAIADYTKAIELKDDSPAPWINRAIIYAIRGDYDRAIAGLTRVLEFRADHVMAMTNRAGFYAQQGKLTEAEADVRRLKQIAPDFPGAIWTRAVLQLQRREYERAVATMDKLIAVAPEASAFTTRSVAYAYLRRFDRARADIAAAKKAEKRGGICVECWLAESVLLSRQGLFGQASALIDAALAKYPDDWRVIGTRCYIKIGEDRLPEALAACDAAIKARPKPYNAYTNRASVHLKLGDLDKALPDYDTALKLGEWTGMAHFGRGLVLRRKGDLKKGDAAIALARKMFPKIDEEFALIGLKP